MSAAHDLDREMLALRACVEALLGLDSDTRLRVMQYLKDRFVDNLTDDPDPASENS